ncbi:MAG: hypothetical protein R2807_11150 [Chitinophagales bacterium]
MATIKTKINVNATSYKENYALMLAKLEELKKHLNQSLYQEEKHIAKAKAGGKFLARERIDLLLDKIPFFRTLPISGLGKRRF